MPFYIINANGIYPLKYDSYEQASADCEAGEYVYIADSVAMLEDILEAVADLEEGLT